MTAKTPDPADDRPDEALADALRASRRMVDAPEALIQRTLALFEPMAARVPPAARPLLPRVLAALRFDSAGHSPLAFGMRSTGGDVRQLLYALPDCDVDLRVAPAADGRYGLSGQLLGPACHGVVFAQPQQAVDGAEAGGSAALNELGEFRLPPLPAGAWRLTLELADRTIELPTLELAAATGSPA